MGVIEELGSCGANGDKVVGEELGLYKGVGLHKVLVVWVA